MFTRVTVINNNFFVNGKKLHEVALPDCIDCVVANSGPDTSYEFLRNKNVLELTGPLESVNRALEYFTPRYINIDRIDSDEQVNKIPKTQNVMVRYIGPDVNIDLFRNRHDVYLSALSLSEKNETIPLSKQMLIRLDSHLNYLERTNKLPSGLDETKQLLSGNLDNIIKDFCSLNDMYGLAKFINLSRYSFLKFANQDLIDKIIDANCTPKQKEKIIKLKSINP
jgi:hypothetical protein